MTDENDNLSTKSQPNMQPGSDERTDIQLGNISLLVPIYPNLSDEEGQDGLAKDFPRRAPRLNSRKQIPYVSQPEEDGNLLDRFQMELGSTDNRSGRQQVITRFKINDQLYLIGDAGVDGQFTGRLKYLIRFR